MIEYACCQYERFKCRLHVQVHHCKHNLAKRGIKEPSDIQCEFGSLDQVMAYLLECSVSPAL